MDSHLPETETSKPQPISTQSHILILQHPQEPDQELNSARLAHSYLSDSTLSVGLSWPNLAIALGAPAHPTEWGVLYLGSGSKDPLPLQNPERPLLYLLKKDSSLFSEDEQKEKIQQIKGWVVLDGTWSQAKSLWWRNAWLLKLQRAILIPPRPSLYGKMRKEPRKECVSTLESIAYCLEALEENPEVKSLHTIFKDFLAKQQPQKPSPKRAPWDRRRRGRRF